MTDYKEEQRNEIEALQSIYPEEIELIKEEPSFIFTINVQSQDEESQNDEDKCACCTIQFSLGEKYPDEAPVIEITEYSNLEDDQIEELMNYLNEQVEENLGMVMVFTLVSAVQERMTVLVEEQKKRVEDEKNRREREEEEAEQKRFEGTKVTIENFVAWKTKFDAEMAELKRLRSQTEQQASNKLSGKEMFLQDATMNESDVQFLKDDTDSVEVDESLFQDMDDLDLDDDENAG
ncbi:RWD domain-containing protein 1-like [Gigantopelta aegis]|uniref:RWD domain-containing protein 1-like n=1 Tax=Gigantopelta aegis TaxID=1735272 RepID=UPI001B88AC8A|nr:RWD domain-containing protein 1-like [Gigantopelta aegis]